jgi:hypothetical protein
MLDLLLKILKLYYFFITNKNWNSRISAKTYFLRKQLNENQILRDIKNLEHKSTINLVLRLIK